MANMHQLLKAMIEKGASDLHITTGTSPQLRIDGKLHPFDRLALVRCAIATEDAATAPTTDARLDALASEFETLGFLPGLPEVARARAELAAARGDPAARRQHLAEGERLAREISLGALADRFAREHAEA